MILQMNLHGTMQMVQVILDTGEVCLIIIMIHKHQILLHGKCLALIKNQVGGTYNILQQSQVHIQHFGITSEMDIFQQVVEKVIGNVGQDQQLTV